MVAGVRKDTRTFIHAGQLLEMSNRASILTQEPSKCLHTRTFFAIGETEIGVRLKLELTCYREI